MNCSCPADNEQPDDSSANTAALLPDALVGPPELLKECIAAPAALNGSYINTESDPDLISSVPEVAHHLNKNTVGDCAKTLVKSGA